MEKSISLSTSLREVLTAEAQLLEQMNAVEQETQNVLVKGDARALQGLNERKEGLIAEMEKLEQQRKSLLPGFPGFPGFPASPACGDITLRDYIRRENPPRAGELESLRRRLLRLHSSLQRRQSLNRHLLQQNLQFVQYAVGALFPGKDDSLYHPSGQVEKKPPTAASFFDSSA